MPMGSAFLWSSLTLSHYLAKKLRLPLISSGKLWKPNEFHRFYWRCGWCCTAGVPHLWDLVPDDLMWSWCSNRRNKVHNKWSALESSWNHPPPSICEKLSSVKLILDANKVEDSCFKGSTGDSEVKNLPVMQETWIQSLGWEDLLEKERATHSSILAWEIPWTEEPGGLQSTGSQESDMT